jgi:hypothetical protein
LAREVIRRISIVVILLAAAISTAKAQDEKQNSDTLEVHFHQGVSMWDPSYKENGRRMEGFVNRFRKFHEDSTFRKITKIHISAGCSPEGTWDYNQRLSKNRVKSIRHVLNQYIEFPDSVVVEKAIGINWELLHRLVTEDADVPFREEVLHIIENSPELHTTSDGKTMELRKKRLIWNNDGKPWKYMYDNIFPALRSFNLQIVIEWKYYKLPAPTLSHIESHVPAGLELSNFNPGLAPVTRQPVEHRKPFYMAAKTNMLYDLALIPNAGLEFYLGSGFSLEANYMHAWWKSDPHNWYWRTYGGDIGIRYWFGRAAKENPLSGHHIGAYGQVVTYDFELGSMGIIGGKPGGRLIDEPNWTAGLEYGYSVPVAKRLNIDFSIGIGYHWGVFYEYVPIDDCYVWQATKMRNYIGPTKVGISLVYLIGKGNTNKDKKGGGR